MVKFHMDYIHLVVFLFCFTLSILVGMHFAVKDKGTLFERLMGCFLIISNLTLVVIFMIGMSSSNPINNKTVLANPPKQNIVSNDGIIITFKSGPNKNRPEIVDAEMIIPGKGRVIILEPALPHIREGDNWLEINGKKVKIATLKIIPTNGSAETDRIEK